MAKNIDIFCSAAFGIFFPNYFTDLSGRGELWNLRKATFS